MKTICFTFLILASTLASAQSYIGQGRKKVIKRLEQYLSSNAYVHSRIQETDTSIVLRINEPTLVAVTFSYLLSSENKTSRETLESTCDSCFQKHISGTLSQKQWGWKAIAKNSYVSKYNKKLLMTIVKTDSVNRAMIYKMDWSRKEYENLVNKGLRSTQ